MKIVFAAYESADAFLARLSAESTPGSAGRLRVPTKTRLAPRTPVVLEVGFRGLPNRVLMRAAYLSESGGDAEFDIVPGEEHKRDFLVAVASGKAQATSRHRKHRRFPMRLPARFVVAPNGQSPGQSHGGANGARGAAGGDPPDNVVPLRGDAETDEVSSRGVFIKTPRTLPEGARVTVVLDPCDGSAEMEFSGRVIYTRTADGEAGIGVQFDQLGSDDRKRLRRLINDVKVSGRFPEWQPDWQDEAK